jgi:small-conductance mechanosensitive channel
MCAYRSLIFTFEAMQEILEILKGFGGTAIAIVLMGGIFLIAQRVLTSQIDAKSKFVPMRRIILFTIGFIGLMVVIMVLPMGSELRGQIISFFGVIISAGVVLSSTTLLGNALSAMMMRIVNHFQVGDFIETADVFGRVTNRGIFHTEVQTADRDLMTIPNLRLATNPVRVLRDSGTIIKASVSLGYDIHRVRIEKSLLKAADLIGLKDPFVFITSLGDFSITYVVHGLLEDCSGVLTTRSKLHKAMLDQLHQDGIEIVSPTFMNQRQVTDQVFIPKKSFTAKFDEHNVESLLFDKAELAKELEQSEMKLSEIDEKIIELEAELKKEGETEHLLRRIEAFKTHRQKLHDKLEQEKGKMDE